MEDMTHPKAPKVPFYFDIKTDPHFGSYFLSKKKYANILYIIEYNFNKNNIFFEKKSLNSFDCYFNGCYFNIFIYSSDDSKEHIINIHNLGTNSDIFSCIYYELKTLL